MDVLIVDQGAVRRLLPMDACMDAMAEALAATARGEVLMPRRTVMWFPDHRGALATMPSALPTAGTLGVKVITVFPGNSGTAFDAHQGVVLLFEGDHGRLLAIVDATEITAIRTAAVSGVATRTLARPDAADLAILGSGTQARSHLEAMLLARAIRRVRVWSRTAAHARAFADRESSRLGIDVEVASSAADAVDGADIICTTTSSSQPILIGDHLSPGAHVNAIGAVGPANRELDSTAVARSRLFVDNREAATNEAGEFVQARDEGAIYQGHIMGEIGEVLAGTCPGRAGREEITVFRGVGLAIEDLAATRLVYERAIEVGVGTRVQLGGERHLRD